MSKGILASTEGDGGGVEVAVMTVEGVRGIATDSTEGDGRGVGVTVMTVEGVRGIATDSGLLHAAPTPAINANSTRRSWFCLKSIPLPSKGSPSKTLESQTILMMG